MEAKGNITNTKPKDEKKDVKPVDEKQKRKENLESLLKHRFFYTAAYEIYGGVKGLYDYGPPGCAIQSNILQLWREWFILEDNMQQIQSSSLTPEVVFQTSGHVQKFQDHMVKDVTTGECYRADHLLEAKIDELLKTSEDKESDAKLKEIRSLAGGMNCSELAVQMKAFNIVAPDTGNAISEPFPFNLMFTTQIGPTGKFLGYLRPETAQGMFVNFHRLLEYNGGKLPFAAAQIGPAFRNEIAPRSGLLRVREFTLAEIEHFCYDKNHEKFHTVKDVVVPLLPCSNQSTTGEIVDMTIGDAVSKGIINNQTLAYFIARTHLFLLHIGIHRDKIRFREHMTDEMAHYACGCFDAEIYSSYGWVECVGLADRSAYDLTQHQNASGQNLSVFINFPGGPREEESLVIVPNKQLLGKQFKKDAGVITANFEQIKDQEKIAEFQKTLDEKGSIEVAGFQITSEMVKTEKRKQRVAGKSIIPSVIEPAFGIGRIMYSVLDQSYYVRPKDTQRGVLRLKARVAPFVTSILPLLTKDNLISKVYEIESLLKKKCITSKVDNTGVAVGRRYSRTDELGIPFGITVDFETLEDNTVTLRERDSTQQVRVQIAEITSLLLQLVAEEISWEEVRQKYPEQPVKDEEEKENK